jgi:hypothetical protein
MELAIPESHFGPDRARLGHHLRISLLNLPFGRTTVSGLPLGQVTAIKKDDGIRWSGRRRPCGTGVYNSGQRPVQIVDLPFLGRFLTPGLIGAHNVAQGHKT